jgi:RNA polymerase sigma-70 factor (ECF subfamily)
MSLLGTDRQASDLVERAKSDPDAFGELYDRYVSDVYRFVINRVGNGALAEDITAEVFFKALKYISRYSDRGRPFLGWLYKIAANTVASHYRGDHPALDLAEVTVAADGRTVLEEVIHRDRMSRVQAAIDRLPRAQRLAIRLRFFEDRSCDDVGRLIGKSGAAIKLLTYRAVCRLRRELVNLD